MALQAAVPAQGVRLLRITRARVTFVIAVVIAIAGYLLPTHRYITPERGLGYALGIVGGGMMLLLLVYPARKRARWLAFIGSVKRWFQAHMLLGVGGPLCVLFHANFSLGATNSNIALWSMIVVASSGLVGRYFYSRIHHGLYGTRATLSELTAAATRLHDQIGSMSFLPQLARELDEAEAALLDRGVPWVLRPILLPWRQRRARARLRAYVRTALQAAARASPTLAAHEERLGSTASSYIDRRLQATRRVAELESFERLFSWWHVLHLPLFFMLLIAGVVHVVAVHVY